MGGFGGPEPPNFMPAAHGAAVPHREPDRRSQVTYLFEGLNRPELQPRGTAAAVLMSLSREELGYRDSVILILDGVSLGSRIIRAKA